MESTPTVFESQLDWLTLAVHTRKGADGLHRLASQWAQRERDDGNKPRPFRLNGYLGWQIGRVRYGEREAAGLIQLSGDLAERHFDRLYPIRDNISRLDLAVTVRTPALDDTVGLRHHSEANQWWLTHPESALPSHHGDARGGYTFYLGDRTSDYYFRCYNKQRECEAAADLVAAEHYARAWRYELECKGVTAPRVGKLMYDAPDRPLVIQSFVCEYCRQHGLYPLFEPGGPVALLPGFRRRADRDSRLAWLETAVRPAVKWLLETGDATEVIERLGLVDIPADGDGPQG